MPAQQFLEQSLYRIVSIDPGTNALGAAVLDIDPVTGHITVEHAVTLNVAKLSQQFPQIVAVHGERVSKLYAVEKHLLKFYMAWIPDSIVSEAPYMGAFPQAYAALVECVTSVRRAVMSFIKTMPLYTIDPASVKKSIGVSGKSGDKEAVRAAIQLVPNISFNVDIATLDEHAVDAIAVGIAHYKSLMTGATHGKA